MEHHTGSNVAAVHSEHLTQSISRLGHLLELKLDEALSIEGITARQFNALLHISRFPDVNRTDLAHVLRITPQAAGGLTRRLHERGLIERIFTDPMSPITFVLTCSGKERLRNALPIASEAEQEALSALSTEAAEALIRTVLNLLDGANLVPNRLQSHRTRHNPCVA